MSIFSPGESGNLLCTIDIAGLPSCLLSLKLANDATSAEESVKKKWVNPVLVGFS